MEAIKEMIGKFVVLCMYVGLWFIVSIVLLAMGVGALGMIIWSVVLVKVYRSNQ